MYCSKVTPVSISHNHNHYVRCTVFFLTTADNATEEEVKALFDEMDQLASLGPHSNLVSLQRVCTVGSE